MPATAELDADQDRCYCPDCRMVVDADATQCPQCGAMFPAMHDRQGSYSLAFTRILLVPIAVVAISMAVFGCASLLFPGGWVNLFPAIFCLVIAVGLGHMARRLYTHPDSFWQADHEDEANLANWQRLAMEHLPQSRATALAAENHVDLWQRLKETVTETDQTPSSTAKTGEIFQYAWWCVAESGNPDLRSAVETFFYEDLPVYCDLEERLPIFLTPTQFQQLEPVFAACLTDEEFKDFRTRYLQRLDHDTE